jgi:hypothetical protein
MEHFEVAITLAMFIVIHLQFLFLIRIRATISLYLQLPRMLSLTGISAYLCYKIRNVLCKLHASLSFPTSANAAFATRTQSPGAYISQQLSFATIVTIAMAAVISAINAKIRSQPVLNYVCSTRESLAQLLASNSHAIGVSVSSTVFMKSTRSSG